MMNRRTTYAVILAALLLTGCVSLPTVPAGRQESVRHFGAAGDGKADDTAAFEKALAAATTPGDTVIVPPGKYRLTRPLVLARQNLLGLVGGGWNEDSLPLPQLIVDHTLGPAVRLNSGAGLHGVAIVGDVATRMTKRPPMIAVAGQANIANVRLQYPYDGIVFDSKTENGRTNIENVFVVSPGHDGVVVTACRDVPTLRNIEVWCNLGKNTGAGFRFGQNDELHAGRLFAFGCRTGFVFDNDAAAVKPGDRAGTYGTFVDCATDACDVGWRVSGWQRLNLVGGDQWNHQAGLVIDSPDADVKATGGDWQSNGEPAIDVKQAGTLLVTGCTLRGALNTPRAFVEVAAARVATLTGNAFAAGRPGLVLGRGVRQGTVSGNAFESPAGQALRVESAGVVVSGNSEAAAK